RRGARGARPLAPRRLDLRRLRLQAARSDRAGTWLPVRSRARPRAPGADRLGERALAYARLAFRARVLHPRRRAWDRRPGEACSRASRGLRTRVSDSASRVLRASTRGGCMPDKRPSVKNERQYEALRDKGMSKQRAARIANSPAASRHGGKKSGSGGSSSQGGTTAQKKTAGRKGGRATARKRS